MTSVSFLTLTLGCRTISGSSNRLLFVETIFYSFTVSFYSPEAAGYLGIELGRLWQMLQVIIVPFKSPRASMTTSQLALSGKGMF
jgi:hypothetical protein